MQIKKDQIIMFTEGEYSDYSHRFFGKALRDFSTEQTVEDLKRAGMYETMQEVTEWGKGVDWKVHKKVLKLSAGGVRERWFRFLIQTETIVELDDIAEVHMGSYGEFKPY